MPGSMEFLDVKPSEVTFHEELFESEHSLIYRVTIRGTSCVMKLIRNTFEDGESTFWWGIERNPFVLESVAYRRMKSAGLCDRGIVPQFYGTMERLDPAPYAPYMDSLLDDVNFPEAILLEYIPGAEVLSRANYTRQRMDKFTRYLQEIHNLLILHEDIHPRNMWVFPDSADRVMWIDFNRAQSYKSEELKEKQEEFARENRMLDCLRNAMEADIAEGRINRLAIWYEMIPEPLPK